MRSIAIRKVSTSVTITDPLVKYRTLVASGVYAPDPAQHRLATHLRKIYLRLKDYKPAIEYQQRLKQIADITSKQKQDAEEDDSETPQLAIKSHPIWNNPLFSRLFTTPEGNDDLSLVRVLTNHQAALEIDSPKGLFLSGEVGTGKSMLLDLLSDGLPTHRKRRWHFNTFMLYTFSQLEKFRSSHPNLTSGSNAEHEYSLLWMAKKLVDESPILFLDEFQLPDKAASKILSHLFMAFFQLGGVLIASSNRVPEELQRAIGVEYTPPPAGGFIRSFFNGEKGALSRSRGALFGQTSDFAAFLEVLRARCDFWHMEGATDWRRKDVSSASTGKVATSAAGGDTIPSGLIASTDAPVASTETESSKPSRYFLPTDSEESWQQLWGSQNPGWEPATITVYGRVIPIPQQRDGCAYWDFEKLVESSGPADYITMASTYHTFIIDNVPVLTILKKNEARRFITLLDALYEARCKLIIRAERGPDELFFPETRSPSTSGAEASENVVDADAIHSETFAEAYQDSSAPFRPNISFYDTSSATSKYDPDQDSDFGLVKGKTSAQDKENERKEALNFGNTSAFTGEDERFAYKRAASRLWEMCSAQWHDREGDGWWRPLPVEARHWEKGPPSKPRRIDPNATSVKGSDAVMGPSVELEEPAGLERWKLGELRMNGDRS